MRKIFLISIIFFLGLQINIIQAVSNVPVGGFSGSLKTTGIVTGHADTNGSSTGVFAKGLHTAAGTIISAILSFIGILAFALIIYGGIIWMMARGNEQEAKKAQDILKMAIIGLIIVFAAYAISSFVIGILN